MIRPPLLCLLLGLVSCGSDREGAAEWRFDEAEPGPALSVNNLSTPEEDPDDAATDDVDQTSGDPLTDHEFAAGPQGEGVAAVEAYCDAYPEIHCNYVWDCLTPEQRAGVSWSPTREHCQAAHEARGCGLNRSAENGNIQVDDAALQECVRAAEAGECFDVWACASKALRPTVARGESCTADVDCEVDDDACRFPEPALCAVRTCAPRATEGEYCAFAGECAAWLVCLDEVCVASGPRNTFCDADHPCDDGLECMTGAAEWGYCAKFLPVGEPCAERTLQCDPRESFCDYSLQPGTPFCRPITPSGGACTENGVCANDHYCSEAGLCEPISAPGEACTEDAGCWYDHACRHDVCQLSGEVGSGCRYDRECLEWLVCVDRVCSYRLENGDECRRDGDCVLTSNCVDGACVDFLEQCEVGGMP